MKRYFREVNGREALRFFTRPEEGGTTIDVTQVMPEEVVLGDLYFESPSGLWDRGTYTLVIHVPTPRSGCRSTCDKRVRAQAVRLESRHVRLRPSPPACHPRVPDRKSNV